MKKFILTEECNSNIEHDSAVFESFYYDFRNDNLKNYNIALKKIQKFYIRSLFKSNMA